MRGGSLACRSRSIVTTMERYPFRFGRNTASRSERSHASMLRQSAASLGSSLTRCRPTAAVDTVEMMGDLSAYSKGQPTPRECSQSWPT